jgi:hypothetical protein
MSVETQENVDADRMAYGQLRREVHEAGVTDTADLDILDEMGAELQGAVASLGRSAVETSHLVQLHDGTVVDGASVQRDLADGQSFDTNVGSRG